MGSKGRYVKSFVKINIDDNLQYGLFNLSLKVKRGVLMNYGFEEQVHGGDEMTMYNCTNSEEASYHARCCYIQCCYSLCRPQVKTL